MEQKELKFPSKPENIIEVEKFAEEVREVFEIDDEIYGNMLVALTEAANNAIIHGNQSDEKKVVAISLRKSSVAITFTIRDQGTGFDYNNLPDPTAPENIDKPTGRGVFLMKHLSDLVVFSDKGSTLELQFKV